MLELVLSALYDSEINFKVVVFWDLGFEVGIGDSQNGWKETRSVDHADEIAKTLTEIAIRYYPNSRFAKERNSDVQTL